MSEIRSRSELEGKEGSGACRWPLADSQQGNGGPQWESCRELHSANHLNEHGSLFSPVPPERERPEQRISSHCASDDKFV